MIIVIKVARDARSGRFTTRDDARHNPDRTVVETIKVRRKAPRRVKK
ncbi:MAG: hypothetical protein JO231_05070 [Acidobacteria bacterium]|nr:hypothetical protein [Acidobacteriota bacterium]